jgi:ABC-2 type transport system ATP-binding protein
MIEITHLQKFAGQSAVIDIEALVVDAGEVSAVVGPVGSGKAALLALLIGQSQPTAGTVRVAGLNPIHDRDQVNRQVGVLFAENALYERRSVRANLSFYCRLRGLPESRADEVLTLVGLADQANVPAGRLPQPGLARRLAFGRTIVHEPRVLLLQEPFAECDLASIALLKRLVRQAAAAGKAVLILAREVNGLLDLCRTIYELDQGRVARSYSPEVEPAAELPFKIPARLEDKVALLNPSDILFASADGDRTYLHTLDGQIASHFNLAELEQRLARSGFFRAHRSYLVNLQRVKAVIPYTRDSFTLALDDPAGTQIPLSKTSARELRELLGY